MKILWAARSRPGSRDWAPRRFRHGATRQSFVTRSSLVTRLCGREIGLSAFPRRAKEVANSPMNSNTSGSTNMIRRHLTRENISTIARAANPGWSGRQWLLGAAWFFILFSLVRLIGVIGAAAADPSQSVAIVGGDEFSAPLLTYAGGLGAVWAWLQTMVVAAAAVFTLTPVTRFRRIGHAALIAWAGFWTLSFFALTAIEGGIGPIVQSIAMTGLLGATCYRAWTGRNAPEKKAEDLVEARFPVAETPAESESNGRAGLKHVAGAFGEAGRDLTNLLKRGASSAGALAKKNWSRIRDGHHEAKTRCAADERLTASV